MSNIKIKFWFDKDGEYGQKNNVYYSQDDGCTWEYLFNAGIGEQGPEGPAGANGKTPVITEATGTMEVDGEVKEVPINVSREPDTEANTNYKFNFDFGKIIPDIELKFDEETKKWYWYIDGEQSKAPVTGIQKDVVGYFDNIGRTGTAAARLETINPETGQPYYLLTIENLKGESGREIVIEAITTEDNNVKLQWRYNDSLTPIGEVELVQGKDYQAGRLMATRQVDNKVELYSMLQAGRLVELNEETGEIKSKLQAGDNITIDEDTEDVFDAIKPVNYTVVSKTDINGLYLYKIQDINGKEYSAINLYDYKNLDGQYLNPYVQDKFIYTYVDNEEYSIIVSIYNDNDDFSGCYFQLSYKEYEGATEQIYDFFVQRKRQTLLKNDIVNVYTNCKWSINEKIDNADDKTYRSAYIYINKPINKKGIITITPIVYFNKRPTIVRSVGAMSPYLWYYENNTKQELEKLIGYKCNADTVKADSSGLKIGESTTLWEDVTDNQIDTLLSNGSISIVNASLENHNSGKIQFFKYKVENDSTYHFTFTDNIYIQLNPIGNDVYDFKTTGEPQTINIASPQKEYEVQNGIVEIYNNNFNVFIVDCILDIQGLKLNDKVRDEIIEKAFLYNQLINNNLKYKEANDDSVIKYPVKVVIEEMRYIDFTRKQIQDITFLNKTEIGSDITNFTIDNVKEGFYSLTIKYQGWNKYATFSIYVPNFTTPKEVRYMLSNYGTGSEYSGTNYRKMYIHKIIDKI